MTGPYAFKRKTWVAFDDDASLKIKCKYALLRNLGGVGLFGVDSDDADDACGKGKHSLLRAMYATVTQLERKPRQLVRRMSCSIIKCNSSSRSSSNNIISSSKRKCEDTNCYWFFFLGGAQPRGGPVRRRPDLLPRLLLPLRRRPKGTSILPIQDRSHRGPGGQDHVRQREL